MAENGRDFGRFYGEHFAGLCKQLYAYHGDRAEAQDLVQEAFVRAWMRWATVSRYQDPAAWVRQVAWRLAVSRWRRTRTALAFAHRQREQHAPPPDPEHVTLVAALATLPENQRRAVVLHHLADLSVAEIAEQEGAAVGTVKSWLHRGRAALAGQLDDTSAATVLDGRYDDGRA
ncbi:SigE family RNA polymerase sigma factor [Cryptosporangium aurantiacum]|uniref:RNA polymerase sigma-70 factor, ECF subfamily n=1 Tax=Cryptosporangium aurantiacum TaxID=134849 RepID=A0A1M7Q7W0_9ACTN|nr:SigE family RNA polymerase sigma factor [Cryptosporangium aurantiacum]SHN26434.1 RNA polymerase sigma-70 factor, ECF subfamily [Cryptosporangium aurantiacum]